MTGALIGLQVLCVLLFVLARITGQQAWFWLMGLAALGLVVSVGLTTWGPVLGLGRLL